MNFSKENKKFYIEELKGKITNYFTFNIKSLNRDSEIVQQKVPECSQCHYPLLSLKCPLCSKDHQSTIQTAGEKSLVYKQVLGQNSEMGETMILCIDLSGSMSCSYKSKYQKVNEQLVSRVLGEKNFQYLKKKIGLQKVLKNYLDYQMFLNQGQSARNIAEMVKAEESSKFLSNSKTNNNNIIEEPKQPLDQYISRKQIIEIATSRCISIMKGRSPNTQITAVYFNDHLEIPTDNFNDKIIIPQVENFSVQQMIALGVQYSSKISKAKASNIGQNLIQNLTKSYENGQTALGPALAFCLGLAKSFQDTLHQIVVITDGMSNIGFGQTENELQKQSTIKFYQKLAIQYAKPLNCVVDVITFEDCCIGYEQIDSLVEYTGGIPCQIQFHQEGGEKVVTQETFSNLSFKMVTAFCNYTNQLCFQNKFLIYCNNPKVKIVIPNELKPFVEKDLGNTVSLSTKILSSAINFQIYFQIDDSQQQIEGAIKFVIINQFKKNNKRFLIIAREKIKVLKGSKEMAEKEELLTLQKEIKESLKTRQIFQEDIKKYQALSQQIEENENIMNNLDKNLLQKFNKKKELIHKELQNIDKLSMQKLSMRSRAEKTYKEDEFDDGFI